MKSKSEQAVRIPSLLLAAALQVLPMIRAALPAVETAGNVIAIIFRWSAAAAAALGGVNAVSGASTAITNPLNVKATNGVPFSLRLTTAPDQAHYWTATGLPAGLAVTGISGQTLWKIEGTPAATGIFTVSLTAKDQANSGPSRTVTATLTLNVLAGVSPPTITGPPASLTVTQGQSATFTVTASGAGTLAYQWRFKSANLAGRTSSTLTLNPVSTGDQGNYDVIVSNAGGSVTSSLAMLTVVLPPTPPAIVNQPTNQTVLQGQTASFAVTAAGSSPLLYHWRFGGNTLANQTNSTLILNSVSTNAAGNYDVVVSNSAGSVTSLVAVLTVNLPVVAPAITVQPTSLTVIQGQTATFDVTATGTAPLTYFWRKGTAVLSASTNSSFRILNAQLADAGSYSVIVSNSAGTATSDTVALGVNPPPQAPFIIASPGGLAVGLNRSVTLSVSAGGSAPLAYQWYFKSLPLAGQTTTNCTIAAMQPENVGSYFVIVTNSYGSATSSVAELTLVLPPSITLQPASVTNVAGSTAHFSVTTSSTVPLGYQWLRNGIKLADSASIAGAQSNALAIANVTAANAGNFSVVITNFAGAITSQVAVLTVLQPPAALSALTLQINGSGSVNPNYNGQMLAVGSNYVVTATQAPGFVFSSWSGSLNASTPTLSFVMQSNLVLVANFAAVPSAPRFVSGTYNGLFYEAAGISPLSSGSFTARTTSAGTYSGKLTLGGKKYSVSGQFDASGRATNFINRGVQGQLTIELAVALDDSNQIQGRVTDGNWSADLIADRAVFDAANPAPQAGNYTFVLPGITNDLNSPAGASFGTMTVDALGRVKMKGVLADGSRMSQSATFSKRGEWPLHVPLYKGAGLVIGWIAISNQPSGDLAGLAGWIKGQQPADLRYPLGFNLQAKVSGSRYSAPSPGGAMLAFTNGVLALMGGDLASPIMDPVSLSENNQIIIHGAGRAQIKVTTATGLFKGSASDPATGRTISFSGVLLQKQKFGNGFFLSGTQSGNVHLGP